MNGQLSARELLAKAEAAALGRVKAGKPAQLSPSPVINAAKDEATVYVYDAIGSWYGVDPLTWVEEFRAIKARTIHLRINSPGGVVTDAEAMRVSISQHSAKVIAHIDGMAASAATGLACACSEIEMAEGAWWMIHDAWGCVAGFEQDMISYAGILRRTTDNIAAAYVRKTGKSLTQIKAWMAAETWFTAAEALQHGFADRIYRPGQAANAANQGKARADLNSPKAWRERELRIISSTL